MKLIVKKSMIAGSVEIPGSKSHTIRALVIASLAEGESIIRRPLVASDTMSAVDACRLLGARIDEIDGDWIVRGISGMPSVPDDVIDVGNSGTTLYIALGMAALVDGTSVFTGDDQIRRRPAGPIIDALSALGAGIDSTRDNGMAPIIVRGPLRGGEIELDGSKTSQYLSSLLINCPIAQGDTIINVTNLTEKPYVEMTLRWIEEQGISVDNQDFRRFAIPGRQKYKPFDRAVPADWSSATFFLCVAAITGGKLAILGLDPNDTQGDKAVVDMLRRMGANIEWRVETEGRRELVVSGGCLCGATLDLADTPDALPALAVTACFAQGETRLINVGQARLKETDRITVMFEELSKMGADVEELPDGLVIRGSKLHAADVRGHGDHRVIMALAVAGLCLDGETDIYNAEALSVTFPNFVELMKSAGADMCVGSAPNPARDSVSGLCKETRFP
ncbi:MAG: 3-phosphoshikimate 1-carboxyvinyltransferase [Armatimonadota bacterium]|nr:3-phosphoshikimate 1-carboxyvinyltransferase [bacterium]